MRMYKYSDPDGEYILTEEKIMESYYEWWAHRMRLLDRGHMTTRENCLKDWITVHWAQEHKPG